MKIIYFVLISVLLSGCAAKRHEPLSESTMRQVETEIRLHLAELKRQRAWDDLRETEALERIRDEQRIRAVYPQPPHRTVD